MAKMEKQLLHQKDFSYKNWMNLIRLASMKEFNCLDTETRLVKFKQQVEVAARKNDDNQGCM